MFYYEQRIADVTPESHELFNPVSTYNPIKVSELAITDPKVIPTDLSPISPVMNVNFSSLCNIF